MTDADDDIPIPGEPVLSEAETSAQLADDRVRWVRDMLVTALHNRGIPYGDSVPEMINALTKSVDDSRAEVVACHHCWDHFVQVLVPVMPDLKARPLFTQAEMIRHEIVKLRENYDKVAAMVDLLDGQRLRR